MMRAKKKTEKGPKKLVISRSQRNKKVRDCGDGTGHFRRRTQSRLEEVRRQVRLRVVGDRRRRNRHSRRHRRRTHRIYRRHVLHRRGYDRRQRGSEKGVKRPRSSVISLSLSL